MTSGYIATEKDNRDYPVCMAYDDSDTVKIPENFTTSFQPPFAKQLCGNCVAQTLANILEVMYYNAMGRHEDFSVGFIYGNRTPFQSQTEGMTGYMACGNLCRDGDVKSALFDNPGSAPSIIECVNSFKEQNPDWKKNAYIPGVYIRTENADEVKRFIYKYNIPVMGIVNTKHIGGCVGKYLHAMALYGWKGSKAIFQNSWGENHRKKTVEIDFDKCEEFWMITPFSLAEFSDIGETHWAYNHIIKCVENKIVTGYPDGTFKPERSMTRAECAAMIYRMIYNTN